MLLSLVSQVRKQARGSTGSSETGCERLARRCPHSTCPPPRAHSRGLCNKNHPKLESRRVAGPLPTARRPGLASSKPQSLVARIWLFPLTA